MLANEDGEVAHFFGGVTVWQDLEDPNLQSQSSSLKIKYQKKRKKNVTEWCHKKIVERKKISQVFSQTAAQKRSEQQISLSHTLSSHKIVLVLWGMKKVLALQ
jgi:hypothetical protein